MYATLESLNHILFVLARTLKLIIISHLNPYTAGSSYWAVYVKFITKADGQGCAIMRKIHLITNCKVVII